MPEVRSVQAALAILRFLVAEDRPLGANAIARAVGLSPSSCFNLLKTLAAEQLLEFSADTKAYVAGPGLAALQPNASLSEQLFKSMRPDLTVMARQLSCTTTLWRLVNDRLILIDFVTGSAAMHINFRRGMRLPSLIGAMGRCVAGDLLDEPQKIAKAFGRLAWQNAPSLRSYMRDAQEAKTRGWATDIDLYVQGLTIVAAPIRDRSGKIAFSVANVLLSGPKRKAEIENIGQSIRLVAERASRKIER